MAEVAGRADLHVHSDRSDGACSPAQLVEMACRTGLSHLALCDHDTTAGIEEAYEAAEETSLTVVPAVEIGCQLTSKDVDVRSGDRARLAQGEVHLLAYVSDFDNSAIAAMLGRLRQSRINRIELMVQLLKKMGMDVSVKEVLGAAGRSDSPGRPHAARVLVNRGYAESVGDAFERFLAVGGDAYVPREKITCRIVMECVLESGGLPVMAHPGVHRAPLDILAALLRMGLRGVEVVHRDHSLAATRDLLRFARANELLTTGGSDYHGRQRDPALGEIAVPRRWAESLVARLRVSS